MKENIYKTIWDVVVIGGGPAGMMSAGKAGENGSKVLLIEKNNILGKKLRITGGGRCNVMNAETNIRKLLDRYGADGKFLFSTITQYTVEDTMNFFHSRGMETKTEAYGRVFPTTDKAETVLNVLVEYIKKGGVTVLSDSPVFELSQKENKISSVLLKNGKEIHSKNFILATGGLSRPETGSTGDGFTWLTKLGHAVTPPSTALVPIAVKDEWVKILQGISLPDIKITVFQDNKKVLMKKGKILFTHFGLSGPTILNMSRTVGELLGYGDVIISLDILPGLDNGQLNTRLQELFKTENKKLIKNSLSEIIPTTLVPIVLERSLVPGDTQTATITREQRISLIQTIKKLDIEASHLLGTDKAIISSGGLALSEVDFKTMQSRLYPNLYIVGDVLNIDRPSGGFSLQLCWTTGAIAGLHSSKNN